jgi:peptidoglycan/LPS O-acetylase OafA/YrhL
MAEARAAVTTVEIGQYAPPDATRAHAPSRSEPARNAPLDGLRGVAILLVLVHNTGAVSGELSSVALKLWASLVNPGWVGVQLFFALSGFLITRILLDSKGEGAGGYFRRFYMRRVLRIFPLYYVALAVVFFVAPHVHGLEALAERGPRSSLWYWSYLANWALPFGGLVPSLGHFWSLAVEEQFYIVWPALVLALRERSLAILCTVMAIGAFAVRAAFFLIYEPVTAGSAAYNFTVARCDALAMGALVALLVRHPSAMTVALRWAWRVALVIVVVLPGMFVRQRGFNSLEFPIATAGQTLLAALSAALVLLCVAPPESARTIRWQRAMSAGWLRSLGKYSYAIYVIHLPLSRVLRPHVAARLSTGSATQRLGEHAAYVLGIFALSYLLALVSWYAIEQPFLSLKRFFPMPSGREARTA